MNPAVRNLRRIGCPLVESSQHCSKKKYSFHKYFIPTNKFSYRRVPSNVMSVPTTWKWSRKQVFWGVREVSKKYQTMLLRNAQAPQKHKLQQGCFQWLWQRRKQWKLPEKGKTAKCELYCIKHINQAVSRFSYAELVAKLHIFLSFLLSHSPFFCSLSRAPTLSTFFVFFCCHYVVYSRQAVNLVTKLLRIYFLFVQKNCCKLKTVRWGLGIYRGG